MLISDAAGAIANGFFAAFPGLDATNVTCWFHVKKAVYAKLKMAKKRDEVMANINKIHLSHSKKMFVHAIGLFFTKWNDELRIFCKYFKRYWVDSHFGWYEGFARKCPYTCPNTVLTDEALTDISLLINLNWYFYAYFRLILFLFRVI